MTDEYSGALADANEDEFFQEELDHRIEEAQRRAELAADCRIAAHIIDEFDRHGPLALYLKARREEAVLALRELTVCNCLTEDGRMAIVLHQRTVNDYVHACEWVRERLIAARNADAKIAEIAEEYGNASE